MTEAEEKCDYLTHLKQLRLDYADTVYVTHFLYDGQNWEAIRHGNAYGPQVYEELRTRYRAGDWNISLWIQEKLDMSPLHFPKGQLPGAAVLVIRPRNSMPEVHSMRNRNLFMLPVGTLQ